MDFVRFTDGHEVRIVCFLKPLETPMNEDVVHNEVGQAVKGNANANPKSCIRRSSASDKAVGTRYGENDEEGIVLFKESRARGIGVGHAITGEDPKVPGRFEEVSKFRPR